VTIIKKKSGSNLILKEEAGKWISSIQDSEKSGGRACFWTEGGEKKGENLWAGEKSRNKEDRRGRT